MLRAGQKTRLLGGVVCALCVVSLANAQNASFLSPEWSALNPEGIAPGARGGGGIYYGNNIGGNAGDGRGIAVPLPSAALLGMIGLGVVTSAHRRRPSRS